MRVIAVAILLAAAASAAGETDLQRCAEIPDDKLRLSCFDALASGRRSVPEELFGRPAGRIAPSTPEALDSRITALERTPRGRAVLHLANGQVWRLQESDHIQLRGEQLPVRIRKGMLGAFYLQVGGKGRSYRVQRVDGAAAAP